MNIALTVIMFIGVYGAVVGALALASRLIFPKVDEFESPSKNRFDTDMMKTQ